jgi:hypothetical protein
LFQSTSTVPGSVIRVLTCSRFRNVILELPLGRDRENMAAGPGSAVQRSQARTANA